MQIFYYLEISRKIIFICLEEHEKEFRVSKFIKNIMEERFPKINYELIYLEKTTRGQVETVLHAKQLMDSESPLIIYNIDTYFISTRLKSKIFTLKNHGIDGMLGCFTSDDENLSFVEINEKGLVKRVREKEKISSLASTGLYVFSSVRQFIEAAEIMIKNDRKVKDEFLDKVLKRIKHIIVGDPLDTETNMGSMISKSHLAKVDSYIQKGIDEGASILHGGVSDSNQKGFFAKPTLFDNVKENMTIAQDEIFGPVLGVLTVNNTEEALKIAKNSKYGLHASVFTQDINKAFHIAKNLPCGTVSINTFSEGDIKTPFGGYKQSGSLSRDQGTEALNQYLQTKTIWISHN